MLLRFAANGTSPTVLRTLHLTLIQTQNSPHRPTHNHSTKNTYVECSALASVRRPPASSSFGPVRPWPISACAGSHPVRDARTTSAAGHWPNTRTPMAAFRRHCHRRPSPVRPPRPPAARGPETTSAASRAATAKSPCPVGTPPPRAFRTAMSRAASRPPKRDPDAAAIGPRRSSPRRRRSTGTGGDRVAIAAACGRRRRRRAPRWTSCAVTRSATGWPTWRQRADCADPPGDTTSHGRRGTLSADRPDTRPCTRTRCAAPDPTATPRCSGPSASRAGCCWTWWSSSRWGSDSAPTPRFESVRCGCCVETKSMRIRATGGRTRAYVAAYGKTLTLANASGRLPNPMLSSRGTKSSAAISETTSSRRSLWYQTCSWMRPVTVRSRASCSCAQMNRRRLTCVCVFGVRAKQSEKVGHNADADVYMNAEVFVCSMLCIVTIDEKVRKACADFI